MRRTEALPREAALTATRRAAPSPPRSRTANFPVRRRCLPVRCRRSSPEPSGARPTHDAAEGSVKFIELDTARRDIDEGRENPRKVTLLPRSSRNPRGEAGRPRTPPARRSPCGGSVTPRTPARGRRAAASRPLPPPPTPALPTATAPRPRSAPPRGVGGRGGCPRSPAAGEGCKRRCSAGPSPPRLFRVTWKESVFIKRSGAARCGGEEEGRGIHRVGSGASGRCRLTSAAPHVWAPYVHLDARRGAAPLPPREPCPRPAPPRDAARRRRARTSGARGERGRSGGVGRVNSGAGESGGGRGASAGAGGGTRRRAGQRCAGAVS